LHSRLHQPTESDNPSPVVAGLAVLLNTLSGADKRSLAGLLLTAMDTLDKSPARLSTLSDEPASSPTIPAGQ
jgi:hypothetical protein